MTRIRPAIAIPWLALLATTLYRHTWGACDCPALRRRLATAHRETHAYQAEGFALAVELHNLKTQETK